jgi:beta-mannosidase
LELPVDESQQIRCELVFEGLDTLCHVWLMNRRPVRLYGMHIFSMDNMHCTRSVLHVPFRSAYAELMPCHQITISSENIVVPHNMLFLHFRPAHELAKEREATYGAVRAGSVNLGDPARVYVRKAQYDWRCGAPPARVRTG